MSTETVAAHRLCDLGLGELGVIDRLELPEADARRLMELGFLPGSTVSRRRRSPLGGPDVFRIDDAEIALRSDTAAKVILRDSP